MILTGLIQYLQENSQKCLTTSLIGVGVQLEMNNKEKAFHLYVLFLLELAKF